MELKMLNTKKNYEAEREWVIQVKERFYEDRRPLVAATVSIYRIPKDIMQLNEKAYIPQFAVLGPYHRTINAQLQGIEEHKIEAVRRTLKRISYMDVERLVENICCLEERIRDCYEEILEYNSETLGWRFTMDGCFCLEFFRASFNDEPNEENYFSLIFTRAKNNTSIWWQINKDIFKLENQIPLKVLTTILELEGDFENLVKRVVEMVWEVSGIPFIFSDEVKSNVIKDVVRKNLGACHLLGLYTKIVHSLLMYSNPYKPSRIRHVAQPDDGSVLRLLPPAVELDRAGIKLKASNKGEVRFERRWFRRARLFLPKMYIDYDTEVFVRNLMAFEERRLVGGLHGETPLFCNFMVLMDYLIDSERDIALLRENEIITSGLGSNQELANIFNTLCRGYPDDSGIFDEIGSQIRQHYNNRVNKWCNYVRKQYCATPCLAVSLLGAIFLLIMTAFQTVYTILGYYYSVNHK
uniref:Uncharacterized protein n=1 Tax=Araucaria cunninghamii TaxID=56994 RepID=A0A0D6R0A6_ARACU